MESQDIVAFVDNSALLCPDGVNRSDRAVAVDGECPDVTSAAGKIDLSDLFAEGRDDPWRNWRTPRVN